TIRNKSDKVMRLLDKKLEGSAKWNPGPPLEIEAAKNGKPGEAKIVIETTKGWYGEYVKNIFARIQYEVVGLEPRTVAHMTLTVSSIRKHPEQFPSLQPPSDQYKFMGNAQDSEHFEFLLTGGNDQDGKSKDSSAVSCRIT